MGFTVPQEIHFLSKLTDIECREFRHELLSANFQDANVATEQTIFTFDVPVNLTWIVTEISLRQLNPSPTPASDFRSDDIDYNGKTNAWIVVRKTAIMAENAIQSSALFNRPVLLPFKGGNTVKIKIQRDAASLPASAYQIELAINGYFAPPEAYERLALNKTDFQQP